MNVVAAGAEHADALVMLFHACGCGCFCRFWHVGGDKNVWLARMVDGTQNEGELRESLRAGDPSAAGLVALADETALGWMKLAPRASLAKLRARPPYKRLDLGDDDGVLSVGCMIVHPAHRREGVARALLAGAIQLAHARGARAIEAYPHSLPADGAHPDALFWMGPRALFDEAGFVVSAGEEPYPVLRRAI